MRTFTLVKKGLPIVAALLLLAGVFGCENEGPAEGVGEKLDKAVENVKEKISDFFDKDGPAEKAGEQVDEAVKSVKKQLQEATSE